MPTGLLTAAVFAGVILATLWLILGGGVLTALGIYVVSGNLLIIGLLAGHLFRSGTDLSRD